MAAETVDRTQIDGRDGASAQTKPREWLSRHTKGTLICVMGMLVISPDPLFLRKLGGLDIFTIMFYRGFLYIGALVIFMMIQTGSKSWKAFTDVGALGLIAGIVWGAAQLFITYALSASSVGSVLVINSANPVFSAIFSRILLGETVKLRTVIAGLVCFASIFVIFFSEIGESAGNIGGVLCALGSSSTMGLYFTLLRYTEVSYGYVPDSNACNIIAGVFSIIVSIAVLNGDPAVPTSTDWVYLFLDGSLAMAVSFVALSIGPSMISAPEVSLCTLSETPVAPIWVFLAGYERPSNYTIGGGAALLIALVIHSVVAMYEEDPAPPSASAKVITAGAEEDGDVEAAQVKEMELLALGAGAGVDAEAKEGDGDVTRESMGVETLDVEVAEKALAL